MPFLFIHAINSDFHSRDEGAEYRQVQDALATGLQGAAALAADDLTKGKTSTSIEVRVEQADGTTLLRSVLSLSVAPLLVGSSGIKPDHDFYL